MKRALTVLLVCVVLAGCGSSSKSAGGSSVAYPKKGQTIQLIVGFAPGGTTDTWARVLADQLSKETGARVQVVNKPGAGTAIAQSYMLGQPKDGSTVSVFSLPSGLNYIFTGDKAPFKKSDFAPVGCLGYTPNTLAVRADSPYKTLKDVIDAARAKPGKLNAAYDGAADDAVVYTQLKSKEDVTFNEVTFNGGSEKVQALLSGDVDFYSGALSGVMPQVKSGQSRVVAVFDSKRSSLLPDVPTAMEQGVDVLSPNRQCLVMSTSIAPNVRQGLEDAMKKLSTDAAYNKANANTFVEAQFLDGAQMSQAWTEQEQAVTEATSQK